jgi:hypothetical protein
MLESLIITLHCEVGSGQDIDQFSLILLISGACDGIFLTRVIVYRKYQIKLIGLPYETYASPINFICYSLYIKMLPFLKFSTLPDFSKLPT